MSLADQDSPADRPDLVAAAIAAWPVLGKWQSRLNASPRFRRMLGIVRGRGFQRGLRVAILAVFLGFLALAVYRNWAELRQYGWRLDPRYAVLAVACFPAAYVPTIVCWHWIVRRVGGLDQWRINAHIFCLSSLGRYVPGAIWYVAGRAYLYQDAGVPVSQVVIGTIWENVVFVTSGLLVYVLLGWQQPWLAGLLLIAAVLLYPTILNRLFRQFQAAPLRPADVLALFAMLGLAWAAGGLLLLAVTNALVPVGSENLPFLIGAWGLAGAVSVIAGFLVGGLGIRELTLGALLGQVLPVPVGVAVAVAFRLVLTVSEGVWAITIGWLTRPARGITQKD